MKRWRMRTTLMVSLLAVSLGLTATCLLIIRLSVGREIQLGLNADISHSLNTFSNEADQRNQMLAREASLLADLPSLKALLATQDRQTIQDGSGDFWTTSGSDFFALSATDGKLFTYANRGPALKEAQVTQGLGQCMSAPKETCLVALGDRLYQLSIQPLYFGPAINGSQLGWVAIGYAVDQEVARQISDVATAEVVFLINGKISATTLPPDRRPDLESQTGLLHQAQGTPQSVRLRGESYTGTAVSLPSPGNDSIELVVLKSYDRASNYLRRVNRWIVTLGVCALLIGLLLAAAISRTVTRPVEALVAGTRALGRGDFHYRFSTDGAVEVRELSLAFERMRGELQRTQNELLESDRLATIGRMASSISHDLRHHLSAIYANAEFMSLARSGEEERIELLLEVKEAVRDMTDLIESLLLFSQTGQPLQLHTESLSQIIERTVHSVRQHPECRDVRIVIAPSQRVEVPVDGPKLGRAIYNLVLNACQASRKGAVQPTVTVALSENEEIIQISVTDTGTGVPAAIRDTLFQPFVSSGKVNGTGLGLTVAQHIAQEHGGEVKVEDISTEETTFSIILYKKSLPTPEAASMNRRNTAALLRERSTHDEQVESTQEKP
ncbi:signal transduction histidine kinase [Granulicella aggregans]|uniref:histidine kinase n=1 Tax=Granulicella aggregans TaxID=474949 RepID=A0A7W8E6X1_9BACT|nr:ATP-binding protein [Granulicella aggregans]MBB5059690.1 signal transduction histidine kinase [Granulicella aggregans]